MTVDLITFLRARLEDDEQTALAANGDEVVKWFGDEAVAYGESEVGQHIARWLPSRVLAEVEAKRRILDAVERYLDPHPGQPCTNIDDPWDSCDLHVERMETALNPYALRLLALPYTDRPGLRRDLETVMSDSQPEEVTTLVAVQLVPVEVFGAFCDHPDHQGRFEPFAWGLCDAVQPWSDCNRAEGHIFRVDDVAGYRRPEDSIRVWVSGEDKAKLEQRWGSPPDFPPTARLMTMTAEERPA